MRDLLPWLRLIFQRPGRLLMGALLLLLTLASGIALLATSGWFITETALVGLALAAGLAASIETLRGDAPVSYHNDHSRPERPVIRTLDEEIARVVRSRVVNPKWIEGVKRHGYKGAFEMAATVDYLFAFAAATGAVRDHHFDLVYDAYLEDEETRAFLQEANAPALAEIEARLAEAVERELWRPKRNAVADRLVRRTL